MNLQDKVAIVTGGASGLGEATVSRLVEKGAKVVIFDLNEEKGKELVGQFGDKVQFALVNVADQESVQKGIQQAIDAFGAIHVCVNCAGIGKPAKTIGRKGVMALEDFTKIINVNLIGTFNVLRLAANEMKNNEPLTDSGERGVIINTASAAAFEGQMGQAAYSASKGGIVGMTLPLTRDLAEFGIRVASIAPGMFLTPMAGELSDKVLQKISEGVEFPKRLGRPYEYAELATFIMEHEYVNGEVIRLDGGVRLSPR
ncbi:SDR family NAD(P)-dependent oxidoreductase [Rummeliibacillus pycnus]|uniref:SDR family NAD(P)-dependent oxidoreductase n=1 Tax=Rummeliibacillus pycnus TaxID=101070 RepID=UPI003D2A2747